jgi:hypothetical protein
MPAAYVKAAPGRPLPPVEAVAAGALASPECNTDGPEQSEHHGNDPQEMEGKSGPGKYQYE